MLSDRFDPEHSDIFDDFFGLREALAEIVGRDVDLIVARAVRNPYFKASAFNSAQDVYVARFRCAQRRVCQISTGSWAWGM